MHTTSVSQFDQRSCFLPFCLFSLVCHAAQITVPGDYSTIQAAIDAAVDGDEIVALPGIYYKVYQLQYEDQPATAS